MRRLRPGGEFIEQARAILQNERVRLAGLLGEHELVLVGGSCAHDTLTKGDVDLHLRVPAGDFGQTVTVLRDVYQVVHPEIWQESPPRRGHGLAKWRSHEERGNLVGRTTFGQIGSRETVTPPEEVRPMNAVRTWVLPLVVTVGRLT